MSENVKKTGPRWKRILRRVLIFAGIPIVLLILAGCYMFSMPGRSHTGLLPELTADETALSDRLRSHVVALARDIGERNYRHYQQLQASEEYVARMFRDSGYAVQHQEFVSLDMKFKNIEVEVSGTTKPAEIIIIGAHYDSALISPGANDNGSGTAALLEIARTFAGKKPARTVRFVAFVNEEPPFFRRDGMGSWVYAKRSAEKKENIIGMLSLETIGCFSDAEGSQHYPFPFGLIYPSKGNFIGFVGNLGSRGFVRQCIASFRTHTKFPSEGVAAPSWVPGIDWSDHRSFWEYGYSAIMITDTAPFRYAPYHTRNDTPDRIDYDRMARVVAGIARLIEDLSAKQQ